MVGASVALLIGMLFVIWLYETLNDGHRWDYRNPYDRTCLKCGRHEEWESHVEELPDGDFVYTRGNWEVFYPIPHTPEACRGNKDWINEEW